MKRRPARGRVYFGKQHGTLNCQIYTRDRLEPGHKISGPAVIEQLDTTTVIHPEQQAMVDDYRNLIVKEKNRNRQEATGDG